MTRDDLKKWNFPLDWMLSGSRGPCMIVSSKSYLGGETREVNAVIGREEQSFILARLEGYLVIFVPG